MIQITCIFFHLVVWTTSGQERMCFVLKLLFKIMRYMHYFCQCKQKTENMICNHYLFLYILFARWLSLIVLSWTQTMTRCSQDFESQFNCISLNLYDVDWVRVDTQLINLYPRKSPLKEWLNLVCVLWINRCKCNVFCATYFCLFNWSAHNWHWLAVA